MDIRIELNDVTVFHNNRSITEEYEEICDFSITANDAYINCSETLFDDKH